MLLQLRWYGIDVDAHRLRPVNVSLPHEDIHRLEMIKKKYSIPYGEIVSRALFYLKADIWRRYERWDRLEMRDKPLPYRSKKLSFPNYEEVPLKKFSRYEDDKKYFHQSELGAHQYIGLEVDLESVGKYRGYVIKEQLDQKIQEALKNTRFDPEVRFDKVEAGKKSRVCFRMKDGDIKLLGDLSRGGVSLGICLHNIINRVWRIYRKEDGESFVWPNWLIRAYKAPWPVTFAVRESDCRNMDNFMRQYEAKYSEKLTKSEIVALAYHLFKKMGTRRQGMARSREKREGKSGGRSKKISVSFSYEGREYWKKHKPERKDLRAALHSLLRSKKFWGLVGG